MNDYGGHRQTMWMSPARIRFTQDTVAMCFQNGNELNTTCEEIAKGKLNVQSFRTIRVLFSGNDCYSVDNRRLYVFRVLNILGRLPQIAVKKINTHDRDITTQNNGCHVKLRNRLDNNQRWIKAETYRHCSCNEGRFKLPKWWSDVEIEIRLPNPTRNVTCFPIKHSTDYEQHLNFPINSSSMPRRDSTRDDDTSYKNIKSDINQLGYKYKYNKQVKKPLVVSTPPAFVPYTSTETTTRSSLVEYRSENRTEDRTQNIENDVDSLSCWLFSCFSCCSESD